VPGAFELPLQAKMLASSGLFHAIVAIGLVADGGIYRHEFVASAVIDGLMQVQLESHIPVLSVVLTPIRFHDSGEHRAFFHEHFKVKGTEAARACLGAIQATERVRRLATETEHASCRPVPPKVAIAGRSET
jgi:6,7-dimethyl-8-ribityllumazine synthase